MRSLINNKLIFRFKLPIIIGLLLVITALFSLAVNARAQADTESSGKRLISIHDRGQDRGIVTDATSLRDVFEEANIELDKNDLVEPGLDETLLANNYEVNIYRARPVVIVDGNVRQKVMSPYQTAKQISTNAGFEMNDEDIADISRSEDIISDGNSLVLTIDRATEFNLVLYGQKVISYTQESTVAEMLAKKDIKLGLDDTLSVDPTTTMINGMTIEIWRNGKQTVSEDKIVAFETESIKDADRDLGYREIKTPGENGKKVVTYEVVMKNGIEQSRQEVQSVIIQEAKKQVEIIGTKVKSFGGSCGEWMAAAGITDMANASYLINAESRCNPNAVNRSSGACGVGQALPCSKTGCQMGDGACQTAWMNRYVIGRYGSWAAAADHHRRLGWY